jgi:uncharacterized protein (DUF2235 family)
MNFVLLTEGTGQGLTEKSNVSRLAESLAGDDFQRVHLEHGCGSGHRLFGRLMGSDAVNILISHYEWLAQQGACRHKDAEIFIFGFSRGALIARVLADLVSGTGIPVDAYDARRIFKYHRSGYAEALAAFRREGRLSEPRKVRYLGLWDTVDSTVGIRGEDYEKLPAGVEHARHAVSRDERRRFFSPLRCVGAEELVFPGTHSDVGGTYPDNHVLADLTLAWVANRGVELGLRLRSGVEFSEDVDLSGAVVHDSQEEPTNAWGRLEPVKRILDGIRRHAACAKVAFDLI